MMQQQAQWLQPEVDLTTHNEGELIIQNRVALEPYPRNLVVWLHQNAQQSPAKPFLVERRGGAWFGLSFADTLRAVNRLSNGLVEQGIDARQPVAVLSENCIDMAVLQLAVMQIGVPVIPISYAYSVRSQTGEHIKHILDVTGAQTLVVSDAAVHWPKVARLAGGRLGLFAFSNADRFEGVKPISALESSDDELSAAARRRFDAVQHDTSAKIQFTSGSTNLPKGVEVTHGMMTSNQVAVGQMWPFLDSDEVVVDWLPWNHTFGGNFVFNLILRLGGTFYIDNGSPTPPGIQQTVDNILDVAPSIYFGVPRSYTMLRTLLRDDQRLRQRLFERSKFLFTAAAALDQTTFQELRAMSLDVRGEELPFLSAWGCTETAPDATLVYWSADDARVIGVPIPGVQLKLVHEASGRYELRIKGPNVTRGYINNPAATSGAFDEQGFYRTGDTARFLDRGRPSAGLIFDGRIGEDFKLSTGTWVHNLWLRNAIQRIGQPMLLEVVVAAPDRDFLTGLIFPNIQPLRGRFPQLSEQHPDDADLLRCDEVRGLFAAMFQQHNREHAASSERFVRLLLLDTPPRIDHNEITDKGYINQRAVLQRRPDALAALYQEPPPPEVIVVDVFAG
jgi:feruloyl-CoA synthase